MATKKSGYTPQKTKSNLTSVGNPQSLDAPKRVLRKFRLVFNTVKTHFQSIEKKVGLGGAQIWALSIIATNEGIGVSDLAIALDIHQTTASNLVRGLVKLQMVEVRKDGVDRRTVQLHVLPAGVKILKKAPAPFSGVLPHALEQLDEKTLERLDQDLAKLMRLIDTDASAAHIPLGHK
jgi:DNA-binding MarR family transcriptional regulator